MQKLCGAQKESGKENEIHKIMQKQILQHQIKGEEIKIKIMAVIVIIKCTDNTLPKIQARIIKIILNHVFKLLNI